MSDPTRSAPADSASHRAVADERLRRTLYSGTSAVLTILTCKLTKAALGLVAENYSPWPFFLAIAFTLLALASCCLGLTRRNLARGVKLQAPSVLDVAYLVGVATLLSVTLTGGMGTGRVGRVTADVVFPGLLVAYLFTLGRVGLTLPKRDLAGELKASAALAGLAAPFAVGLGLYLLDRFARQLELPKQLPQSPASVVGSVALLCFLVALAVRMWLPDRQSPSEEPGPAPAEG